MEKEDEVLQYLLIPLYLISLAGESLRGKTRLQKLVFLTQKESKDVFDFEFEPAPLGPLSHKLNHLLERMIKMGLLKEEIGFTPSGNEVISYKLTRSGKKLLDFGVKSGYVSETIQQSIEPISSKYGNTPYVELLDYVHDEYPEYKL
ncbi:MAG: hypothetical protein QXW37_07250 [Candidatus Nitrosotenuis sp.]